MTTLDLVVLASLVTTALCFAVHSASPIRIARPVRRRRSPR